MMHTNGPVRLVFVLLLLVSPFFLSAVKTDQRSDDSNDQSAIQKWEYLVVANPSRTNFSPTGNPNMRKEEVGSFGHEAFVLEQHMDRLGAKGWELVQVSGPTNEPVFYFKRPKRPRG